MRSLFRQVVVVDLSNHHDIVVPVAKKAKGKKDGTNSRAFAQASICCVSLLHAFGPVVITKQVRRVFGQGAQFQ